MVGTGDGDHNAGNMSDPRALGDEAKTASVSVCHIFKDTIG